MDESSCDSEKCSQILDIGSVSRSTNLTFHLLFMKENKDASLVIQAFSKVNRNLKEISMFYTERGNEFKNRKIDDLLQTFERERSLSMKGC